MFPVVGKVGRKAGIFCYTRFKGSISYFLYCRPKLPASYLGLLKIVFFKNLPGVSTREPGGKGTLPHLPPHFPGQFLLVTAYQPCLLVFSKL